jgi:hypothetical protein
MKCPNCESCIFYYKSIQLVNIPWKSCIEVHRCSGGCGYEVEVDREWF